jgi:c-di-AMP phosphodiesterase-like protein
VLAVIFEQLFQVNDLFYFMFVESAIVTLLTLYFNKMEDLRKETAVRLASFIKQIKYPIIEIGNSGEIFFKNEEASEIFPNLGHNIKEEKFFSDIMDIVKQGDSMKVMKLDEKEYDGKIFNREVYYLPETDFYRIFLYDISDIKAVQKNLECKNTELKRMMDTIIGREVRMAELKKQLQEQNGKSEK